MTNFKVTPMAFSPTFIIRSSLLTGLRSRTYFLFLVMQVQVQFLLLMRLFALFNNLTQKNT